METINTLTTIKKEVIVQASQETAFTIFTRNINEWWPRTHHIGQSFMIHLSLEGKPGGRWFSRHKDGSEVNVGYILHWDPFSQLILAWQIDGNVQHVPSLITEVVVNFISEGPKITRVTLEHRDLLKLTGGTNVIESMDAGWGMIINLYKQVANEA